MRIKLGDATEGDFQTHNDNLLNECLSNGTFDDEITMNKMVEKLIDVVAEGNKCIKHCPLTADCNLEFSLNLSEGERTKFCRLQLLELWMDVK